MKTGLDRVCADPSLMRSWGTCAIVTHATTATSTREPCVQALTRVHPLGADGIACVYGPQHGYWQCEPYNMFETPDSTLELAGGTSFPLYSLYGETRQPRHEHLRNVDTLVVDLPDIGCRVYTYMTTLAGCLRVAAAERKRVVVLDRPNPLGLSMPDSSDTNARARIEGNVMQPGLDSFVGWFRIPMRHGLTLGELGKVFCEQDQLDVAYEVITVEGLSRDLFPIDDPLTERILPFMASPNMPDTRSIMMFPLAVALEGTNISEGRGTTAPFQLIGAPFIDENLLCSFIDQASRHLNAFELLTHRPCRFMPRFDKFSGQICRGVALERASPRKLETGGNQPQLFRSAIALLAALACTAREDLKWRDPGYEYNFENNPLDLILGSPSWRMPLEALRHDPHAAEAWSALAELCSRADRDAAEFSVYSQRFWLYS
jgi:uncharacterized protein YbbC (DUF1343 family)